MKKTESKNKSELKILEVLEEGLKYFKNIEPQNADESDFFHVKKNFVVFYCYKTALSHMNSKKRWVFINDEPIFKSDRCLKPGRLDVGEGYYYDKRWVFVASLAENDRISISERSTYANDRGKTKRYKYEGGKMIEIL